MLKLFSRRPAAVAPPTVFPAPAITRTLPLCRPDNRPSPLKGFAEITMKTAETAAFRALQHEESGDHVEAKAYLNDAGEFLSQLGGPRKPESADAVYQWCAARRAGEV